MYMDEKHILTLNQIADNFQSIRDQNNLVSYNRLPITATSNEPLFWQCCVLFFNIMYNIIRFIFQLFTGGLQLFFFTKNAPIKTKNFKLSEYVSNPKIRIRALM